MTAWDSLDKAAEHLNSPTSTELIPLPDKPAKACLDHTPMD